MRVKIHKSFVKDYRNLDEKIKKAFRDRLELFFKNQYHVKLSNHPLRGRWQGYRSINISGDYRAIYKIANDNTAIFIACGTHSKLYR